MRKKSGRQIALWTVVALAIYFAYSASQSNGDAGEQIETKEEMSVAVEPDIVVRPQPIIQGEAVLVSVQGVDQDELESIEFNGRELKRFNLFDRPSALLGIDLRMEPGIYPLVATLSDGAEIRETIRVSAREAPAKEFGIPEKLGGNTPQSERNLINSLAQEAAIMNAIPSGDEKLWEGSFRLPLDPPITITDTYGYSRITGGSTLSHKGTDFRAEIGTPVYAMNSGLVRFTDFLRNYGHTIVIDHGLGLHTVYMHLSEILVEEGQMIEKGELIARTGDTGYVLGPHLHLSVRIDAISIDPMEFMELFGS